MGREEKTRTKGRERNGLNLRCSAPGILHGQVKRKPTANDGDVACCLCIVCCRRCGPLMVMAGAGGSGRERKEGTQTRRRECNRSDVPVNCGMGVFVKTLAKKNRKRPADKKDDVRRTPMTD